MKPGLPLVLVWTLLLVWLVPSASFAAPVSHLQVRVVTGREELSAGSTVELRIYEAGRPVRRLPLSHGEAWPRESTRVIPVTLGEPLDPRTVIRFSLYYRAASPLTPPWEIASAEVDLGAGGEPMQRLLNATLAGVIARQGELASVERDAAAIVCAIDADCDDHLSCNGPERCAPRSAGADARGCVKGSPMVCPVNQVCSEGHGCRGAELPAAPAPASNITPDNPPTAPLPN